MRGCHKPAGSIAVGCLVIGKKCSAKIRRFVQFGFGRQPYQDKTQPWSGSQGQLEEADSTDVFLLDSCIFA